MSRPFIVPSLISDCCPSLGPAVPVSVLPSCLRFSHAVSFLTLPSGSLMSKLPDHLPDTLCAGASFAGDAAKLKLDTAATRQTASVFNTKPFISFLHDLRLEVTRDTKPRRLKFPGNFGQMATGFSGTGVQFLPDLFPLGNPLLQIGAILLEFP